MTDKMVDVGGRRRPAWSTSADDVGVSVGELEKKMSAADVGVSVGKLDRQCRRPTLADTQADTQSVTLVIIIGQKYSNCALVPLPTPLAITHSKCAPTLLHGSLQP